MKDILYQNFLFKSKIVLELLSLIVFYIFFGVAKWEAAGRVLPKLLLRRDYHQRVRPAHHCEHPIICLILMDNLIPMRWRTSLQKEWQNIELLAYHRSSGTYIRRVTLFQP